MLLLLLVVVVVVSAPSTAVGPREVRPDAVPAVMVLVVVVVVVGGWDQVAWTESLPARHTTVMVVVCTV